MSKVPTAEEFRLNTFKPLKASREVKHLYEDEDINDFAIAFAKLHVEAALKKAEEKAATIDTYKTRWNGINKETYIEKDIYKPSILNAYPLENIK